MHKRPAIITIKHNKKGSRKGKKMSTLAERIEQEMERQGLTQEGLADMAGVSQSLIFKLKRGITKESGKLYKIAAALGVSTDWLATGSGPRTIGGEQLSSNKLVNIGFFSKVRVVGSIKLGNNQDWLAWNDSNSEFSGGFIRFVTQNQNATAIHCTGDALAPRVKNGEFIIIEPDTEPVSGDEVLVESKTGKVMVCVFLYRRDDHVYFVPINEDQAPYSISNNEIDEIKVIVGIAKKSLYTADN
jgi:phage repressor protein C with HTH and peptisase S24 domain